jgi:hypothetical protein
MQNHVLQSFKNVLQYCVLWIRNFLVHWQWRHEEHYKLNLNNIPKSAPHNNIKHIPKQPADPKAEAGLLSIWKCVGDPILNMRSDYTFPVSHHSKTFKVIIDRDYWRNKDPVFPEDALICFTDGSTSDSGTGSGIWGLRPNSSLSFLLANLPLFFKLKYTPLYNVHVKI